ncbi:MULTISPECIES: efflux RND transporter permease subunit [unclassified Rhizobium]|uniref:efflux RND transporter permease subunit n=1 Tax=unclassified Rhizobium TaxID=2613769 RepID=UPI00146F93A0|nr:MULTISPECIES: efflux RND transporter permease subunit [unclassified Rhizobium]MBD9445121.1 efflux RND transporter permease subunit [Rhizobium sp. RHZ01]MBD9454434.1 efflux RND transporter permease subunit [Rhizobium sp. RHZ02]NMN71394.1 multidrug efflux pump subunit AcrB [Rhizobium sp. 57MFTsu3.2]
MNGGFNLSEWAIQRKSLIVFLAFLSAVGGILAYFNLGRDEDPEFTFKTMIVSAAWPGGTIEQTTDQITDRLERTLEEVPHLDHLRSLTSAGQSVIYVVLDDATPPDQVGESWYQARTRVGDIVSTLPAGVRGPFFNDDFGDTFGIIYGFTADGFGDREVRDWVYEARNRLLKLDDIGKVQLIGTQDETIFIEFSTNRLASLGLSMPSVISTIQAQNAVLPTGQLTTERDRTVLEVSGSLASEKDLRELNIPTASGFVRLGDIADIVRGTVDPPQPRFRVDGKPAIGLAVSMASGGDILQLGRNIDSVMNRFEHDLPIGIDLTRVASQPTVVQTAIRGFTTSLAQAVVIVLGVSFLALGVRAGLAVAVSIPLVMALTFLFMDITGIALQRVSLGALIIALTLMIDDTMVTVEITMAKLEEGMDRVKAAAYAYTSTAFPMLAGTLVTIAGFIPVGFAQSSSGEYARSLFFVIGFSLIVSWLVAVLLTPIVGLAVLKPSEKAGEKTESKLIRGFKRLLGACVRMRVLVILATVALFAASLFGSQYMRRQFFPSSDRPELLLSLVLPQDASQEATAAQVKRVEEILAADEGVANWSFYVGSDPIRFYLSMDLNPPAPFRAQAVVISKSVSQRDALQQRLQKLLDEQFPDIIARVSPLEMGPPVGWPVQYRVSGPDIVGVRDLAWKVADVLHTVPGAVQPHLDWNEPIRKVVINVDQDRARLVGLNSSVIAQTLFATSSGLPITQVRDSIYLVNVVARATEDQRVDINTLRSLQIPVGPNHTVPLSSIATVEYQTTQPLIWRHDRSTTITVQADAEKGVLATDIVDAATPQIAALIRDNPNYLIEVGGSVEGAEDGLAAVVAMLPVMAVIILIVLMFQLQSVQRLILVVSVVPLGLIGVVLIMLITRVPVGFIAVLGMIALIGMITRNSVVLIDQIDRRMEEEGRSWQGVIDVTAQRLRPVFLTAGSTILGMLPIIRDPFWSPLAFTVVGGLVVAAALTLIFLPALYVLWFRIPPELERRPAPIAEAVAQPAS